MDAGAIYADARSRIQTRESLGAQNGTIESVESEESAGVGVRALVGSSWGFFAVEGFAVEDARRAGARAVEIARASAMVPGAALELSEVEPAVAEFTTPYQEDPFTVPLEEKASLLTSVTSTLARPDAVVVAGARLEFWRIETWFTSSEGHRIHQTILQSGGGMSAMAADGSETHVRSYPQSFGQFETGGYEVVRAFEMEEHADRLAGEAVALLSAVQCPEGERSLILEGSQLALQIHESVGHAIELDRILGWEAAFAGTSFLDLSQLGQMRYGSELMNITADATLPGALGSFGFDDEGTPAQSVDIVKDGIWVGVLSGRDSAKVAGLPPGGMVRADDYNRLPMVRMTNVGLLAGEGSLDDIIAGTEDGIYMATNRSWSIDDKRLNFQFGCEIGWEVKDGELGRMVKNPTYTGITPHFWGSMDRLAGADELIHWGTPNCGKGQPMQVGHTGHSAAPARFTDVRIGVSA